MRATECLNGSLSALSRREREILQMLAAGHTAKSIAAQLGRSEASINERLREARRKTGVGSSRELARLLASQKDCDKNIDLLADANASDGPVLAPMRGKRRSKGPIIMFVTFSMLAAAGLFVSTPGERSPQAHTDSATAEAAANHPLHGQWLLDNMRVPAAERPDRVTISFRMTPAQKWTTFVEIIDRDGTARHAASTAAADGIPVPVTGNMPFIDTVSLRQPNANTLVMNLAKDGAPVSSRVYAVSADGTTMTETIIWAGTAIPGLETNIFRRQD